METTTAQPRLAEYLRPLAARKWLILVAVAVATGGVYGWYAHKPNVYTAGTLVYVKDPGDPVTGAPTPQSTDREVLNDASLLGSRDTAAIVKREITYPGTADELLSRVTIASKPGEDFVSLTAQGDSAQQAPQIANAFAHEFVVLLNGNQRTRLVDAIKLTKSQLAQLPSGAATDVQRANLLDQLNRLQLALNVPATLARQVDAALPPGGPSSPKPLRDAVFAFILSLIGAIAVAYGIERFDRRLKSPDELEGAYAEPLLAVVPHTDDPDPVRAGEPVLGPDFREPFRVLRTNLELAALDTPARTIVVSSAMPGEGKSTVARNLALAFRESGKRVALVDLDLRHPALARLFAIELGGPGVTDVLRRGARLDDAMLKIGVGVPVLEELLGPGSGAGNGTNGHNGSAANAVEISLLLSGPRPANPPAVLASHRIVEVLDELRARHDVVLIDTAPVLAVTDTVPLLRYADAALFVGRLGVATRDTAKRLREFLARVPDVNVLGVVANDMSRLEAGSYGYGYGYYGGGHYGAEPADGGDAQARKFPRRRAKQTA